jgi:hypothetical protein
MTLNIVTNLPDAHKVAVAPVCAQDRAIRQSVEVIAPAAPLAPNAIARAMAQTAITGTLPARQPLPTPVLYADKPSLKLGLDVHLEFIMAVAQRDHAAPQAQRKFTPEQLILQVPSHTVASMALFFWLPMSDASVRYQSPGKQGFAFSTA